MKIRHGFGLAVLTLSLSVGMMPQSSSRIAPRLPGAGTSSAANRTADEDALRKLNEMLLTAHDHADVATLDHIEADDFTLAGDFGTVAKKAQIDRLRAPDYKTEPVDRKITPQDIRLYGDVALITETDHAHTKDGTFDYETSSVWVRSGENWRIVHMHFSTLEKK